MANPIGPRGLVPSRYLNGSPYNGAVNVYCIPSSDNNQFNPGDAVKTAAGSDANGIPYITKAAGTDTLRGAIVGIVLSPPNMPSLVGTVLDNTVQNTPSTGKSKDYYALVADDPSLLFEIQDDGASTLTAAAANKNASMTVANPTAPQQNSATSLSCASVASGATLPLKLMGLVQKPNNSFGPYGNWLVMINQHELRGNSAGY